MCNDIPTHLNPKTRKTIFNLLWGHQDGNCCYCEYPMERDNNNENKGRQNPKLATFEHLHRKSEGGTNRISNLALSCHSCNMGRGQVDWMTYKSYMMGELYV